MESKRLVVLLKKQAYQKKKIQYIENLQKKQKIKECKILTRDMRYMDKKYGLGSTKDICGKKTKKQKEVKEK